MEFIYEDGGMKIEFLYSAKDFVATYDSAFGKMEYSLHMMLMCPMTYSEKMLRERHCKTVAEEFRKLEKLLSDNSEYIDRKKRELGEKLKLLNARKEELKQKRQKMKKEFKEGRIAGREYEGVCKEVKDVDFDIWKTKSDFLHDVSSETGADLRLLKNFIEGENNG